MLPQAKVITTPENFLQSYLCRQLPRSCGQCITIHLFRLLLLLPPRAAALDGDYRPTTPGPRDPPPHPTRSILVVATSRRRACVRRPRRGGRGREEAHRRRTRSIRRTAPPGIGENSQHVSSSPRGAGLLPSPPRTPPRHQWRPRRPGGADSCS